MENYFIYLEGQNLKKLIVLVLLLVPLTVNALGQGKDLWVTLSVDFGIPYTGMVVNSANDLTAGASNPGPWADGILNMTIGYTPIRVISGLDFGFLGRVSGAFTYETIPLTQYFYTGWYFSVTPMAAARIQLERNFLDAGLGVSFWKYTSLNFNNGALSASVDLSTLSNVSGISPALFLSLVLGWSTFEIGLAGPDVYVGWGVTF